LTGTSWQWPCGLAPVIPIKYPHIRTWTKGIARPAPQADTVATTLVRAFRDAAGVVRFTSDMIVLKYGI
jgi:hypothetical protein